MAKIRAHIPSYIPMYSSVAAPTQPELTAVSDYVSVITQAEEDAVIDRVTGYVNVKAGAVSGTIRVGIQSVVSTTGLPSGTWLGFADFTVNGTNFPDFSTKEWILTTTATLTRGQYYAIVIFALSGTFNATDKISFYTVRGTGVGPALAAFPYTYNVLAGVASGKSTTALIPNFGCGTSTRQYAIGHSGGNIGSWNSASSPNQRGIKFNLPASLCTSYKVAGVRMAIGPTNSASTWDLNLYDSSSTVIQNRSYTNQEAWNTASLFIRDYYFDESTLITLSPSTDYRIAVQATSATLGCATYVEIGSAWNCSSAFIPGGTYHLTTRTGTGAWTDTTTSWFPIQLIIDDLTATGGSGGGMIVHPGMAGGMRG